MRCPVCDAVTLVLDTRGVRRRRECFNAHRFSTVEVLVAERTDAPAIPTGDVTDSTWGEFTSAGGPHG